MSWAVILVDYGLALERSFSAEVEDCFDSLTFVLRGRRRQWKDGMDLTSLSIAIQNDFY
jgi:hypothetical protein